MELPGVSRQQTDVVVAVARSIADGWRELDCPPSDRAVLGLTTAPFDTAARDQLCALVAQATNAPEVWLADDATTSGIGGLAGRPGVSITAGTGVACLAVPRDGAPQIVGGHGYLLGDEGGGFWFGRRGLAAVLRAAEGRGPATALTERARQRFGDLTDVHVRLHDSDRPVDTIAQFATEVLDAAEAGDAVAMGIVDEGARELLSLARAALDLVSAEDAEVALGGRLLIDQSLLRRRLESILEDALPVFACATPQVPGLMERSLLASTKIRGATRPSSTSGASERDHPLNRSARPARRI